MKIGQKIGLIFVSLIFSLIGAALFYSTTIHPFLLAHHAKEWISIPCTIVKSELKTDTTTPEPTYEAEIRFRYNFRDAKYISEWYGFSRGYSSDRFAKEALINRYPAGKETYCFVNPQAPTEAVILRERRQDVWFGLFGLPFLLVGLGLFAYVVIQIFKPFVAREHRDISQTPALKIKPVPSGQAGIVFVAIVWNVFIAGALYFVAMQWETNRNYISVAILLLFAIVGILMLYSVLHRVFAIFSPGVEMKVQGYRLGPGERFELSWTISRSGLLNGVEIWLKQGVNLVPVYISQESPVPAGGTASVKIPEERPTNEPVVIQFVGHVKRFPNIDQEFVITL